MPRILKSPWTSQPQVPVGIDWSNPLTRGLVVAVNGATLIDHVSGKPLTITSNNGQVVSSMGVSARFNNAMYGSIPISWSGGPFTLFAVGRCTADAGNDCYCSVGDSGSSANDIILYRSNGNDCSYLFSRTSGTYVQTDAVDNSNLINTFYTFAGVTYSTTDRRIFRDGVQLATTTSPLSIASSINTFYYGVCRSSGVFSNQFDGQVPIALLFNRALSAEEVKQLSYNRWQILAPASRPLYFDVGAAGGTHTTTSALTGQSSSVAGTATHYLLHTSSGVLTGQIGSVSGVAKHYKVATGALTGQIGSVSGVAERSTVGTHVTTGALNAGSAVVTGSATHVTVHSATGVLNGPGAIVVGAALRYTLTTHTSTGALAGSGAVITGSATGPINVNRVSAFGNKSGYSGRSSSGYTSRSSSGYSPKIKSGYGV